MAQKIIVLSGKQFCGKDTVAQILLKRLKGFERIGLGDAIKTEFGKTKGLTREQVERNKANFRQELIDLGDKRRNEDPDYWINKVMESSANIIVPDVRLKHELEVFKAANAFTIRVECDREMRAKRGRLTSEEDLTETDLDDIKDWDYVIYNNSTHDSLLHESYGLVDKIKSFW